MPLVFLVAIGLVVLYWDDISSFFSGVLLYIVLPIAGLAIVIYMFKMMGSSQPVTPPEPAPQPKPEPPPPKPPVVDICGWLRTTWSNESRTRIVRLEVNFMGLPKKRRYEWHDLERLSPKVVMHILVNDRGDRSSYAKTIEKALEDLNAGWRMSWNERWIKTPNVRFELTQDRKTLQNALVLTGAYRNRTNNDLTKTEYAQLCAGLRKVDPSAVSLLSVVKPSARRKEPPPGSTAGQSEPRPTNDPPFTGLTKMTLRDAAEILGIHTAISTGQVKRNYNKVISKVHPDRESQKTNFVGSKFLAQLVNQAYKTISERSLTDHAKPELQSKGAMTETDAASILGLEENASIPEVNRRATPLLGQVHPRMSGSRRLEQLVLQAHEVMLERCKR